MNMENNRHPGPVSLALALALAFALLALAGCGGQGGGAPGAAADASSAGGGSGAAAPADTQGIAIYVGGTVFDASLNPVKNSYNPYPFTNSALLAVTPESAYAGDMAESWTVSQDALTYTYRLRESLKFSDGSDLTAEDVVFTYETVKGNQAENADIDLTRLASVKALDDLTVEFTLSEAYSPFLDSTAMLGIVPSDAYDADAFDRNPIGSGPFKVVQYDANQQIIVEPNEYYHEGAPSIPRITLVNMDAAAALSAAQSGQLDVVMVGSEYASETVDGMTLKPLATMDIRMISLPTGPVREWNGETVGNDVTADAAVRKALDIGIDREAIIQNAYGGIGKPAQSFTPNLIWADSIAVDDGRKDEANALLGEAGWEDADGDGIREKDGLRCSFDVYAAEDRYVLAAAVAEDAKALGIEIVPHSSSWDEIGGNKATAGVVWGWGQFSPTVLYSLFDSEAMLGGYDNVVGYDNPDVDALIHKALGETSHDAAAADWKETQRLANEDVPYLYIANIEHCYFVSDNLDISEATQIPHPHGHGSPIICNMKDWTLK